MGLIRRWTGDSYSPAGCSQSHSGAPEGTALEIGPVTPYAL